MKTNNKQMNLDMRKLSTYLEGKYGIGQSRVISLCRQLGFLPTTLLKRLSFENQTRIEQYIKDIGKLERDQMVYRIHHKVKNNTVQGIRMRLGRPVRGQRTQTNANTAQKLNVGRIRKI